MSNSEIKRIRTCLKEDGEADVEFMSGKTWHVNYDDVTKEAEVLEYGEYLTTVSSMAELIDIIEEEEEK